MPSALISDTNTVNIGAVPPNAGADLRLRQRNGSTVRLPGYGGAPSDATAVTKFRDRAEYANGGNSGDASLGCRSHFRNGWRFRWRRSRYAPTVANRSGVDYQLGRNKSATSRSLLNSAQSPIDESNQEADLWASFGEKHDGDKVGKLSQAELMWMVRAGIERWRTSAISQRT